MRHRNGGYYARLFQNGKESWKSLKTAVLEVAKSRLRDQQAEFRKLEHIARPAKSGRMTGSMVIEVLEAELRACVPMRRKGRKSSITTSSANYRRETIQALKKSWLEIVGSGLNTIEIRRVTPAEVRKWADAYRAQVSSTRFNNTLGTLRRLFEIAIAAGELHRNPAQDIARSYKQPRQTYTPTLTEFSEIVAAIRSSSSRYAPEVGNFVEFCAYTGARKKETAHVLWKDVDLVRECVTLRETKNGHSRTIELIPPAVDLLRRMQAKRASDDPEERLFSVKEAYGSLRAAAKKINIPRISHHDLRDLFATTAVEQGIDVPTIADWLGHQDGGALLLERYRKRRDDHARAAAKRVSFTPATSAA